MAAPARKLQLFSASKFFNTNVVQSAFWQLRGRLQLVGFGVAATELGVGWVLVWVSVRAPQIYASAILACDDNLELVCVFMASGGIGFSSSVSVYNGFGLRNKLRDGPLDNAKARGIFSAHVGRQLGKKETTWNQQ